MNDVYRACQSWVYQLNRTEWLILLTAVAIAGFLCLRGFGSRKNY